MNAARAAHQRGIMRKVGTRVAQYSILSIIVILVFIPLVMLVFGALKSRGDFVYRPYDIPNPPNWDNIFHIFTMHTFWQMLQNSVLVMVAVTTFVVIICSLAAFVFARMQFKAKGLAFNLFTLGLMFPINIAILPVYLVLRQTNLVDSLMGVILVQTAFGLSGNILILRGFFASIPAELQDAAYIDGCTATGFFWRILLPLAKPSLAAVAALTMIVSWNDLLVPLIVVNSEKFWTLPLGTMQFQGQYASDLSLIAAFVGISAIPPLIFYLLAERQIVSGLTAGAIKG
jgi:raffinose/stachyose/melibiose transport system permease protein